MASAFSAVPRARNKLRGWLTSSTRHPCDACQVGQAVKSTPVGGWLCATCAEDVLGPSPRRDPSEERYADSMQAAAEAAAKEWNL